MNHKNANYGARGLMQRVATLSLALCAFLPAAQAKDHKPAAEAAIKVIANMPFDQKPAADMTIREVNGKSYLYVQLANEQGVVVVDVSKPNKLQIVSSTDAAGANQLSINGNAAMLTASASAPVSQSPSKSELVLWDISDPGNPRVVQRFSGVLRVLQDERNYTYVLNTDGLWVVSDKQNTTNDDSWNPSLYGG
jgi:hypothetical protein